MFTMWQFQQSGSCMRASTGWIGFLLAAALASGTAWACINETGTLRSGREVPIDLSLDGVKATLLQPRPDPAALHGWAYRASREARANPSYENLNELAVVLVRLGKPVEAIRLLQTIERRFPGRPQTAPNLGTAYELAGNDALALQWIREGMRRDPSDHGGSEWLHAAILEVKTGKRARVLDLDFGTGALPRLPARLPDGNKATPVSIGDLRLALYAQLMERAQFVRAPDPIMAELLFDWGQLELLDGTMEIADVAYQAAGRYGWTDRAAIARGRAEAARVLAHRPRRKSA